MIGEKMTMYGSPRGLYDRANTDGQENVIGGDAVPMLGALPSVPEFVEMAPDMNYCMTHTMMNE
ncbi:hypothetical protein GJAV_G00143410 [Gymnothorax javanicus]|nr:hypothetical protein GJAV_G00143410 [Gymnothorax javanicus]